MLEDFSANVLNPKPNLPTLTAQWVIWSQPNEHKRCVSEPNPIFVSHLFRDSKKGDLAILTFQKMSVAPSSFSSINCHLWPEVWLLFLFHNHTVCISIQQHYLAKLVHSSSPPLFCLNPFCLASWSIPFDMTVEEAKAQFKCCAITVWNSIDELWSALVQQ